MKVWIVIITLLAVSTPAFAQLGGIGRKMQQAQERKEQFDALNITEEEEIKMGADVSAKIRTRFGVVQDAAVHKYVTLVGTTLTDQSTRAKLPRCVVRFLVLRCLMDGAAGWFSGRHHDRSLSRQRGRLSQDRAALNCNHRGRSGKTKRILIFLFVLTLSPLW